MGISIANRILLGFAAVTAVLVLLGLYAISQIGELRDTVDTIVERDISALGQLDRIEDGQNAMRQARFLAIQQFLERSSGQATPSGSDPIAQWRTEASTTRAALDGALAMADSYRAGAVSAERGQQWQELQSALEDVGAALDRIEAETERQFQAIEAGNATSVRAPEAAINEARARLDERLATSQAILNEAVVIGRQSAEAVYQGSRNSIAAALAFAVILSVVVAWGIRRSIAGPLGAFMGFVERVGRGDLAGQTAATGRDEIGRLGATLNAMVEGLRQLTVQSREATENLNAAATEIRASTQEQAASVEEQLAAVQETAATVDEMNHAGTQIGKRAQEVIASAQATAQTSDAGLRAVDDTTRAMDAIREQAEAVAGNIVALSEKTQAIGEIIATVNDISERSHLLALNAAIEAAAAGESGRSFAVVASEMKTLADQAKDATGQVRSILGDIQRGINSSVMLTEEAVKRVTAGKERTDTTQRTIEEMTRRIQESIQTFQQIVASTNQQQIGIEQVTVALQNIRQASQQTAASTRQLDQAAANLTALSQQLLTLAERYRL